MAIPTLDSVGWVSDPSNILVKLFDYFLTTEKSQSNLFKDQIISFQSLIKELQHDPVLLANKTEQQLTRYFKKPFDTAVVSVVADDLESETGRYNLTIDVVVSKDNINYSLGRVLELNGSKVLNVLDPTRI